MAAEVKKEIELEIAHVLVTDIVGYSKLPINQQRALVERLNEIVRGTDEFQAAEAARRLIKIPTGDGITLVFYHSPEAPVECALEISRALKQHPELPLRMGIHSGPVSGVIDATGKANVTGPGINIAQRIMDCGDAGHILLSKHVAEDLEEYPHWQPHLHELGECEVKHGVRVSVVNLCTEELGNPAVPEKLKAARVAAAAQRKRAVFRWLSLGVASLLTLIAVIGFLLVRFRQPPAAAGLLATEKSIAVLPFENRSRDPDNAYFADGIQDEILTRLSKIADLKVISRTSTQHYKSAPENLPEIATELGVAHILEGSVQKTGDAVRVNVQLIKAANDSHLWADTFDRKLTDIFSVETEVAKAIADQLRAKLTGQEEQVIAAKPTDNPEAYDAYLRGLAYSVKGLTPANSLGAQKYLREAVRLDPKFALAWALLSCVDAYGYTSQALQPTVALREEARQAAETALTLQPISGKPYWPRAVITTLA
jgi:TolB-like protein/class 3 adenylate cyclase